MMLIKVQECAHMSALAQTLRRSRHLRVVS